jgi:hypothetical protein
VWKTDVIAAAKSDGPGCARVGRRKTGPFRPGAQTYPGRRKRNSAERRSCAIAFASDVPNRARASPVSRRHVHPVHGGNFNPGLALKPRHQTLEDIMGFGKGALLWLLGIPLPIIILLALFWR